MGIKVTGQDKLSRELNARLGKKAMRPIVDEALVAGAKAFEKYLRPAIKSYSDGKGESTGATYDEITFSEPYDLKGVRTITLHWRGPKDRYRIIHLNEFGTINNPNPRGKGAIARAMKESKKAYRDAIKKAMRKL